MLVVCDQRGPMLAIGDHKHGLSGCVDILLKLLLVLLLFTAGTTNGQLPLEAQDGPPEGKEREERGEL